MKNGIRFLQKCGEKKVKTERVICKECKGAGTVRYFTDLPGYEGPDHKICPGCLGSGRLLKVKTIEYSLVGNNNKPVE